MKPTIDPLKVANDPLFYDLELPLLKTYHPLGFSLEIATNSEQVLLAAEELGTLPQIWAEPAYSCVLSSWKGHQISACRPRRCEGSGTFWSASRMRKTSQ